MRWSVALGVLAGLVACSGIRHYTYEIELTTDRQPHTVELWVEPAENSGGGEWLAYAMTFPQSYLAYRDNHDSLKQTTIGLLLDRQTLKPLTEVIASETGLREGLEVPRWQEGPLKKAAYGTYAARQLFVTVTGHAQPRPVSRRDAAAVYGKMYDRVGESGGFEVYKVRHQQGHPARGLPELAGYQSSDPQLYFRCLPGVVRCSVTKPYRTSDVTFSIERTALAQAPTLVVRICKLLDQHLQR